MPRHGATVYSSRPWTTAQDLDSHRGSGATRSLASVYLSTNTAKSAQAHFVPITGRVVILFIGQLEAVSGINCRIQHCRRLARECIIEGLPELMGKDFPSTHRINFIGNLWWQMFNAEFWTGNEILLTIRFILEGRPTINNRLGSHIDYIYINNVSRTEMYSD